MDEQIDSLLNEKMAFLTELQENLKVDDILAVKELVEQQISKAEDDYRKFTIQVNRNWMNLQLTKNDVYPSAQVPRGVGKTTALLKKTVVEGKTLITPTQSFVKYLKEINPDAPVISVSEAKRPGRPANTEYLVDDISYDDYNSLVNLGLKITSGFVR